VIQLENQTRWTTALLHPTRTVEGPSSVSPSRTLGPRHSLVGWRGVWAFRWCCSETDISPQGTNVGVDDYTAYANQFVYSVNLPGCSTPAKVFVGQRQESFVIALGKIFDLVNMDPTAAGQSDAENSLQRKVSKKCALFLLFVGG
jgi:hypothetical protein